MRPRRSSKLKGAVWIVVAIATGAAAGLGLPYIAAKIPWSVEERMARVLGPMPGAPACSSPTLPKIVARLYPIYPSDNAFPVSVEIIHGDAVNAFAALGGRIYVFEGLVRQAQSAEELAGVLAHEIEHVRRRHIMQGALGRIITTQIPRLILSGPGPMESGLASLLLQMRFSREQESEADTGGLTRLRDAQVSVEGFERFFERLRDDGKVTSLLSDHPSSASRAELVRAFKGGAARPIVDSDGWSHLQRACAQRAYAESSRDER
jgi:predicted Zn-dependent protease